MNRSRYLERGTVFPSELVQTKYPLQNFPCPECVHGLPSLVDNQVEFYWEHYDPKRGRSICKRFNGSMNRARADTAVPLYYTRT